jgi:hypothetical protein
MENQHIQLAIGSLNLAELLSDAESAHTVTIAIKVDSPATYELAGEELISIKSKIKILEEKRATITGPLNEAHAAAMNLFRSPLDILGQCKTLLDSEMKKFITEQEVQQFLDRKSGTEVVIPISKSAGNSVSKRWKADLDSNDPKAFEKLLKFLATEKGKPYRAVLALDNKVLNAFALSQQETLSIPGVKVYRDLTITSRGK